MLARMCRNLLLSLAVAVLLLALLGFLCLVAAGALAIGHAWLGWTW